MRSDAAEPAFVELDAAGCVMDLNDRARQNWRWQIGARPPEDILWTLSTLTGETSRDDETITLPIVQDGLHVTVMPKAGGEGWFLFGEGDAHVGAPAPEVTPSVDAANPETANIEIATIPVPEAAAELRELATSCFDAHIFRDGAAELFARHAKAEMVAIYERTHPGSMFFVRAALTATESTAETESTAAAPDLPHRATTGQLEALPAHAEARLRLIALQDRYGVRAQLLFIWSSPGPASDPEQIVRIEQWAGLYQDLHAWIRAGNVHAHAADVIDDALFGYQLGEDGERQYAFVTRQMENLTGRSRDMLLLGQFGWMQRVVHADDAALVRAHHANLAAGNESRVTYRVVLPDDGFRWLQEFASPRIGGDSETVMYGILSDVTERREAELMMQHARQEAEVVASARTSFVATMSHEIRTPLGALNGYAQLLARECEEFEETTGQPLPEQIHEFIDGIGERSQKVLVLVQDLFDLSQLEMGQVRLQQNRVNVAPILQRVADRLEPILEDRDIRLVLELDASRYDVLGDARRIEQVLENLASNASKFTEKGRIHMKAEVRGTWVAVSIEDTGIGISPSYLDQVFQAYTQEDPYMNRRFEGTGLGLALSKRLLDLMGGRIEVESRQGEGSRFTVFLPCPDADSPSRIARSA